MRTAVVTVVAGRHDHLRRQLDGLRAAGTHHHVVVAMGDPDVAGLCAGCTVVPVDVPATGLPLARARNAGADAALALGAELLVFLDVDCVPAPDLLDRYAAAAAVQPGAVLSGPVTYLPEGAEPGVPAPHPGRPSPADGVLLRLAPELFWSLSFAVTPATWRRVGGFWDGYTGYGAEDTDFGQRAAAVGVPHLMVGGAHAFHQWHPTQHPPVQHLADLLRNGELFAQRWGWWPMQGWFEEFHRLGLVRPSGAGWSAA